MPKLDRLARSAPDARHIGDSLVARGVKLSLGGATYDPADPREGMAVARAKGKRPKLTHRQQAELARMHATGEYTIAELMEIFSVGRATVYRALERARSVIATR